MKHSEYTAYFREIARRQPDILHTPEQQHFFRVIYSDWPSPTLQLSEYLSAKKDDLHFPFMLLESWRRKVRAGSSEHLDHVHRGSFFIGEVLDEPKDFDALEVLFDKTDRIADDIKGFMLLEFEQHLNTKGTGPKRYLIEGSLEDEKIGPFGNNYYGTRVSFQFTKVVGRDMVHNPEAWIA